MDRRVRHQGKHQRTARQGPEERQPARGIQGPVPERPAPVGRPVLPAVRHRQRGHHRRTPLPVQVRARQPGRLLHDRRHRLGGRPHHGSAVPDPEQAHPTPSPVHRRHDLHDRGLHPAGSLLHQHDRGVHRPRALLHPGHPHPDDRHPLPDRLHRIRPAEERQAQRGRHPVRTSDA